MPEVLSHKSFVARKVHLCDYCGFHIQKGEAYMRDGLKYNGMLYSWKSHIHCNELTHLLNMFEYADEGLSADAFQENISEEFMKRFPDDDPPQFEDQVKFLYNELKEAENVKSTRMVH